MRSASMLEAPPRSMPNSGLSGGGGMRCGFVRRRRGDAHWRQRNRLGQAVRRLAAARSRLRRGAAAASLLAPTSPAGFECRQRPDRRRLGRTGAGRRGGRARRWRWALGGRGDRARAPLCCLMEPVMSSRLCSRIAMRAVSRSRSAASSRSLRGEAPGFGLGLGGRGGILATARDRRR